MILKVNLTNNWLLALAVGILLVGSVGLLTAQNRNFRPYEAWVTKLHGLPDAYGILYDVNDSSIVLTNSMKFRDFETSGYHSVEIELIEKIRLRRKGKLWRSALVGFGAGALAGGLVGNLGYNDGDCAWFCTSRGEETALGALTFGILGSLVGTVVGLTHIRIPINGKKSNFKTNEDRLYKYSYKWGPIAP